MKSVLISIQPKWCELIANGKKTVEVRKTRPKLETPFKVYIYCTNSRNEALWKYQGEYYYDTQFPNERPNKANGKVIGEFVCDEIITAELGHYCNIPCKEAQLDVLDLMDYADEKTVYGWHISNLVIYDKPKELNEFYTKTCISFLDGVCIAPEFECGFQHCIYQGDIEPCVKTLKRPPQSWCYVEELGEE